MVVVVEVYFFEGYFGEINGVLYRFFRRRLLSEFMVILIEILYFDIFVDYVELFGIDEILRVIKNF